MVAEAGLNYDDLKNIYSSEENKASESRKDLFKTRLNDATDKDLDDLVKLLDKHFIKDENWYIFLPFTIFKNDIGYDYPNISAFIDLNECSLFIVHVL